MDKGTELFYFKRTTRNSGYEQGLRKLPLRPCLIRNNATCAIVKTYPKWNTVLGILSVDQDTGELLDTGREYLTNDFKQSNGRKIRVLDAFCSIYQPMYQRKAVSLLFHTFTQANQARMSFRRMLHLVRKRYVALGYQVLGFVWTAEVSEKLHWHYHLCLAILRMVVKRIPSALKFQGLWGRRTGVEFVKKNVRHYMAKYFAKNDNRVIGSRSFGKSRQFMLA